MLGAGATFAATDPQAIYATQQKTIAVDNTYIIGADLSNWNFKLQVTDVTEDDDSYYVTYAYNTIQLQDYVWKQVTQQKNLKVSKLELEGGDLGIFIAKQLHEVVNQEGDYLAAVQKQEIASGASQKIVSTEYSGLIGRILDPTTEVFPGYVPVITPEPDESQVAGAAASQGGSTGGNASNSSSSSGNPSLFIQVLGNNPSQIAMGTSYVDLGAFAADAHNDNLSMSLFLDSRAVDQIMIDTSTTSKHTVRYEARDPSGNMVSAERTIYVYDRAKGPPVPDSQVQHSGAIPVFTPTPDPTPTPTPDTPAPSDTPTPTPSPSPDTTPATDTPATPVVTPPADASTTDSTAQPAQGTGTTSDATTPSQ